MTVGRAVVTGGSRGIGKETALALAASGWSVGVVARGADSLREVVSACEGQSPSVLGIEADVRTEAGAAAIREAVAEAWDGVDVLINNAGVFSEGPLEELSAADLDDAWATNTRSAVLVTQALLEPLRASAGHVINVGSRSAILGIADEVAFSTSKAAIAGFSAALRAELKGSGARVSCLHPGPVNTWGAKGEEAEGLMEPADVAAFLKLVAESDAEFYDVRFGMPE